MGETQSFTNDEGTEIVYRHWSPDGPARASVVVAHGASEHSGRYDRFAQALVAEGFAVFAPDHRGHGLTSANTGVGLAGAGGFAAIVDDLDLLVRIAADAASPLLLLGHSMGSVIGLRYAERFPGSILGLALTGPLGVMAAAPAMHDQLQGAVDAGMADQPMDALGPFNEPFEPARTPFDWLSRDDAEVDKYIADPYCGNNHPLTYGFVLGMIDAVLDGAAHVDDLPPTLPVLLAAGDRDPVSLGGQGVRDLAAAMRNAGVDDVEERYYPESRHEILNETDRDRVTADVVAWLARVVAQTG